ncbi:MAG: hypothetical protein ACKPKJ_01135 [Dolichospermum sp.]
MNSTYKNYELIDIGSNKEPGVYKDNKILIKGVHFDIESCYQSEGVILLNKKGDEFPFNIKLPPLSAAQKTEYAQKLEQQKAIEASFASEWKQVFQEVFVAQTGTATKIISFWRHPIYGERQELKLQSVEIADSWKKTWQLVNRDQKVFENWVKHWEETATKVVPRHPLASKRAGYPELKKYFFELYPELEQFGDYINICMWPVANAVFEYRKGTVSREQLPTEADYSAKYIYKYDEDKKVDEIAIPPAEALERAIAFKNYADAKTAEAIAEEQAKKLRKQREKDYAAYKAAQGKKPCKPFEKWVLTYQ